MSIRDDSPRPDSVSGWFERVVAPAHAISDAPAVLALRESLPAAFIVLVVVFAALVLGVQHGDWPARLRGALPGAFSIMSVVLLAILAVRLAHRYRYSPYLPLAATLAAFAFTLPSGAFRSWTEFTATLGAAGPFTAIVVALIVCAFTLQFVRRLHDRPLLASSGAFAGTAFLSVLSLAGIKIAALLSYAIAPLHELGDSFTALALICALESLLWIVGIHGPALLAAVVLPIYINLQFANFEAYAHHQPLPHIVVVSTFLLVFPGGAGATLPLTLLLARSRVPRLRKIARVALLPAIIGTNEPLLFGLPIVFNPFLAIPFVVAPVVLVVITYVAMALGWVAKPYVYMPSSIPYPLGVYLATLDLRAVLLAIVNLGVAAAIYAPFVRAYERAEERQDRPVAA